MRKKEGEARSWRVLYADGGREGQVEREGSLEGSQALARGRWKQSHGTVVHRWCAVRCTVVVVVVSSQGRFAQLAVLGPPYSPTRPTPYGTGGP